LKQLLSTKVSSAKAPAALSEDHQEMLDKLKGLEGEDFTKQYRSDQEDVHEDAVDLFKRYGEGGENADLRAWASATRPALEHHLEMAKKLNE
jgi:putative membrane protein